MKYLVLAFNLSYFALSNTYADGIIKQPIQNHWHAVIGLGGGVINTTNLGKNQYFPILDPVTDQFFEYVPQDKSQTKKNFEAYLGVERSISSTWMIQSGIAYTQSGSFDLKGNLVQGVDVQSSDQFDYQYKMRTQQILAQGKLMYSKLHKFYPYALLGLGVSFNSATNFSTSVPPLITFTREYQNNTSSAFAYRIGAGVDMDITQHIRIGASYRFANLGLIKLGSATINGISVSGQLSQSNLYVNEGLIQLTYVI